MSNEHENPTTDNTPANTPLIPGSGDSATYWEEAGSKGSGRNATELAAGDVIAGRFEVVGMVGAGGMGAVYQVRDREVNGEVRALKIMGPNVLGGDQARQRFIDEIATCQKLRHDGIVTVFDLGRDAERDLAFFTMEHVEGATLYDVLCKHDGKLPFEQALSVANQLCHALAYAHKTTVHCDLKPKNVMVQADGRVKLLDFGLAKAMSGEGSAAGVSPSGTAYYQAPEQSVHLAGIDGRADLYSLGVILYQMLTGKLPVGHFAAPSELCPGLPVAVDDVVLRCLAPEPEDRFESASAVGVALAQAVRPRKSRKALLAPVGVLVGLVAVVWGVWLLTQSTDTGNGPTPPPPPPPKPALRLTVDTAEPGKRQYAVGETIGLRVRASEDCSALVFCTDSAGEIVLLTPNYFVKDFRLPADEERTVRAGDLDFKAFPPLGVMYIDCYAAREPLALTLANLSGKQPFTGLADGQTIDAFLDRAGIDVAAHGQIVLEVLDTEAVSGQ